MLRMFTVDFIDSGLFVPACNMETLQMQKYSFVLERETFYAA